MPVQDNKQAVRRFYQDVLNSLILIRKSTVSRRAAASGRSPDPIRVSLVDL